MGQIKDLMMIVDDMLVDGYDEAEIASKLDLPVDMIEEIVAKLDEQHFHEDMESMPDEIQEWHDFDPDC